MADLLDIAPQTAVEIVKIDGRRIRVRGVSVATLATLVSRFPKLKDLLNGDFGDNFVLRLIEGVGSATAAIIAAGCGHFGDAEYEQSVENLLPEHQLKLLKAIFGLTFPNGIGFFVEELTNLMNPGEGAKPIKVRLKKSPSTSPLLSDAAASRPTLQ